MGKKMTEGLVGKFEAISKAVVDACSDPTFGENELEPFYIELLEFLRQNERYRPQLVELILGEMRRYRTARTVKARILPGMAIAYVMHELRWPEVFNFAQAENREFYAERMETVMSNLMEAYTDDWEDRIFYERFSRS